MIGANTAVSAAAVASTIAMSPASAFPSISPREAVARIEIGLTSTNASSAAGQRLRLDEDVGEEREREDAHEAGVHDRVRRAQQQPEGREDPGEAEGEDDHERQRGDDAARRPASGRKPRTTPSTMITVPATT